MLRDVPRRVPPLAVAFALIAAALIATTWATRRTVTDAFAAARAGEALAVEQAVRGDLADLGGPPDDSQLAAVIADHEGLSYLAALDSKGHVLASAGTPVGGETTHSGRHELVEVGGRLRVELRATFHRAWGEKPKTWWIVLEVEPVDADELRASASWTLAVGALAALVMLGMAIALVRRELRRHEDERVRERERRLASLGEMSAVLAHEIKNPLASLKGNAQLLASAVPEANKAKAARVVDEAVRLEQLTQDLLAFVRTGELQRAPASPASLVEPAEGIVVDTTAAPATWSLDDGRMRQVVANLVDNAVAAGGPVEVRIASEAGRLVLEVADHGPGVPPEDRDKIFEPFFTKKTRGTGLGLAVARRVVEAHGGTIRVSGREGGEHGAVFRVEIPEA